MKTLCKFSLAIIISMLSSIILFLALLLYSPKFNSWLVLQAANLVPEVSLEKADGLLLGKMHLYNLSYRTEQLNINIRATTYHYKLASLFANHILFESLHMAGVDVEIKEHTKPKKDKNNFTEFMMPVTLEIQDFTLNELQIKQQKATYIVKKIHLALWYQGQSVRLSQFILESDIAKLNGTAELLVKAQSPFKADLIIAKSAPNLAEIKAHISVHGTQDKIHLNADLLAPSAIHAQGWIQLTEGAPSFDLQMLWATLQWPLQSTKKYASKNAQLDLKGTTDQYDLTLDSKLFIKDLPLGQLHLVGQGDMQQFTLSNLSLEALQGNISSKGRISWTESIASDLQLEAKNLQLTSVLPDYLGEFNLTAKLTGRLVGDQDIRMQISHLSGMIMGKPLSGTADIHYQPELTTIKQLNVRAGTNQLAIQGTLAANNALSFKLIAPNLHELSPDLQGELFAHGKLQGLLTKPSIQFDLHSAGLSFQEQKVGALQAKANLISMGMGKLDLDIKAQHITLLGLEIEKLTLKSTGPLTQHKITAEVLRNEHKLI
jgi:translocation and assembly module TamB